MRETILAALLWAAHSWACAQGAPVGLWKTVDEATQKEKSVIRITENDGQLSGAIEKILDPARQEAKCEKCTGALKDRPILGMTLLRQVKRNAEDPALWDGGEILDPNNGQFYKVRLKLLEDGRKLEVRGYVGMPLLGRTQVWTRLE